MAAPPGRPVVSAPSGDAACTAQAMWIRRTARHIGGGGYRPRAVIAPSGQDLSLSGPAWHRAHRSSNRLWLLRSVASFARCSEARQPAGIPYEIAACGQADPVVHAEDLAALRVSAGLESVGNSS